MNYLRIILCALLVLPIIGNNLIVHGEENEASFINSFEQDITGDGFQEYIKLQGNLLRRNSQFYQSVWVDIKSAFNKQWSISLQNGYHPEIEIIDFNHDHTADLFYRVAKDESKETTHYQLYSLKKGDVHPIKLPKHQYLRGQFNHSYKIDLILDPTKKPINIDVSNNKAAYIKANIYNKKGKVQKKQRPIIKQISSYTPVVISESKGYGLKSTQKIFGLDVHDHIGDIETTWYYENGNWTNIQTNFTEAR